MNKNRLAMIVLCFFLCVHVSAQDHAVDKEFSDLSAKLATQIKNHGKKKVAVLDFTDLEGGVNNLGRYVAEQMTVNLVISQHDFTVVDRANLKKILAEHKLTADGLVDPENAKKLGALSGVDALILGTVTPINSDVQITVKVIATDTAEIMGAAKGKIEKSKDIETLLTNATTAASTNETTNSKTKTDTSKVNIAEATKIAIDEQQLGDLLVKVKSLQLTGDQYQGRVLATIVFVNMNKSTPIYVALKGGTDYFGSPRTVLINNRGHEFSLGVNDVTGISCGKKTTEIPAGKSITVTMKFLNNWGGAKAGDYPPYRFQSEVVKCTFDGKDNLVDVQNYNFVFDVGVTK